MADEQSRAEALDDEKFDDVLEEEPPVPLDDDGEPGEDEDDPAPDYYGAGVAPEEAAMHVEDG